MCSQARVPTSGMVGARTRSHAPGALDTPGWLVPSRPLNWLWPWAPNLLNLGFPFHKREWLTTQFCSQTSCCPHGTPGTCTGARSPAGSTPGESPTVLARSLLRRLPTRHCVRRVLRRTSPAAPRRRLPAHDEHGAGRRGRHAGARLAWRLRGSEQRALTSGSLLGGAPRRTGDDPHLLAALGVPQLRLVPDWLRVG